jgi:hypothetical protein
MPAAVSWLRATLLAAALALAFAPVAGAALERPSFSSDGTTLVGFDAATRSVLALDAESGAIRWRVRVGRRAAHALESIQASADGRAALVVAGRDLFRAAAGAERLEPLTESGDTTGGALAPDGRHAAFLRDGALWTVDFASGEERRLAAGPVATPVPSGSVAPGAPPSGFAWSPEGRSVAYLAGGAAPEGIEVVDLLTPGESRRLELDAAAGRRIGSFQWRFDGLAIAVVSRVETGWDELTLCHPAKLHCRLLASRPGLAGAVGPDLLAFLSNGFLWSRQDATDASRITLASHDTLGRERGRISLPGWQFVGVEAVLEETGSIVVTAREAGSSTDPPLRWLLLDAAGRREPRPLGSAPEDEIVVAPHRALLLRTKRTGGVQTLESLDGRVLARLEP